MEENVFQINGGIAINVDASVKKHYICKEDCIWNPASCSCKNGPYLANIMSDSMTASDEIIEETRTIPAKACKTQDFLILLVFLLITIALLIAVDISCYQIKYRPLNGYFEEINGNKYLKLVPTNENKEKILKI